MNFYRKLKLRSRVFYYRKISIKQKCIYVQISSSHLFEHVDLVPVQLILVPFLQKIIGGFQVVVKLYESVLVISFLRRFGRVLFNDLLHRFRNGYLIIGHHRFLAIFILKNKSTNKQINNIKLTRKQRTFEHIWYLVLKINQYRKIRDPIIFCHFKILRKIFINYSIIL